MTKAIHLAESDGFLYKIIFSIHNPRHFISQYTCQYINGLNDNPFLECSRV